MEFVTLPQLARELNKPEKVLRYKFKKLLRMNTLVEGEDFVREGFIDDKHFLYKINPVRFVALTQLNPAPLPDQNGYQTANNVDTNGYPVVNQTVTKLDNKPQETDTNIGNQQETVRESHTQQSTDPSMTKDFIELMKEQLRKKDEQLKEKDDQLKSKDELLKIAQGQAKDKDNAQILALSEIIRLNKKLLPPSPGETVIDMDTNGYQSSNPMDTNVGNQASDVGNNGYQSDTNNHE
jgi:hypothetical protein